LQRISLLSKESAIKLITDANPGLNSSQISAITTINGPLQIIAGPGSGKTLVLVLRVMYIVLTGHAQPNEIVITTFTEKAAFELRDRIHQFATKLGYKGPLNEMKIRTINSFCDDVIRQMINYTPIKRNYEVLDDITHTLFISDKFTTIFSEDAMKTNGRYLGRWQYKWITIKEIIPYFNKIVEELVDVERLLSSPNNNSFLVQLGKAYQNYRMVMYEANRIDFAHQQKIFLDLLQEPRLQQKIKQNIKYIMVDEYQDTNYIQEQILLKLADPTNNICIVGDEDQSLYRFRGATVRNILEFSSHFANCRRITLNSNYQSHPKIIEFYNRFMKYINWTNSSTGTSFRFDKVIRSNPKQSHEDYPAVVAISKQTPEEEAEEFAALIVYLKDNKMIEDYSQVALLLNSVRSDRSSSYIEALKRRGIPYYNPRAKAFFENEEIKQIIGSYAFLFQFRAVLLQDSYRPDNAIGDESKLLNITKSPSLDEGEEQFSQLNQYIDACINLIRPEIEKHSPLGQCLKERLQDIESLKQGQRLDMHLADYFYEIVGFDPFATYLGNENSARNLAKFSRLITIFQNYYRIDFVREKNKKYIPRKLLSFLRLLLRTGINDYEDPDNPIPAGHVQMMTIHQSKGLEFPIVVVGTRGDTIKNQTRIDNDLSQYYHRSQSEPQEKIATFDKMRQYYVAFSRAEKLLVIANASSRHDHSSVNQLISPACSTLQHWQSITTAVTFSRLRISAKKPFIPKKSFGFTSHINFFETCPRQYQLYQEYRFSPSNSAPLTFGILVHQTIEDIHKEVKEGRLGQITNERIKTEWLENNYRSLLKAGKIPLSAKSQTLALDQILDYFNQNYDILKRIVDAEVDVSIETPNYILNGKIDLLIGEDGKYELLDFKSQKKPDSDDPVLRKYYNQLYMYVQILNDRYAIYPERIYIYWTNESDRDSALMQIHIDEYQIQKAKEYFDAVVNSIQNKHFEVKESPAKKVCSECDFRSYCNNQGTISLQTRHQILMAE